MEYTFEKKHLFSEKKEFFCTFVRFLDYFMLFLARNREFSSCPPCEISTISLNEDKANAHAGMPFCSVSRFVVTGFSTGLWSSDQGQQPVWGVGRLRLSFRGSREPRMDKCNDLRLFCFLQNLA